MSAIAGQTNRGQIRIFPSRRAMDAWEARASNRFIVDSIEMSPAEVANHWRGRLPVQGAVFTREDISYGQIQARMAWCRTPPPPGREPGSTVWETTEMDTITLKSQDVEVTIPGTYSHAKREYDPANPSGPIDVALHSQVMIGYPIGITILLRSDGTWEHWQTDFRSENHYLHFSNGSGAASPITEAQRSTLARWYLGVDRPYGLTIGGPVVRWAFRSMDPQEISRKYGDGRRIYMAGPASPDDPDESLLRESLLEQAVEDGRISGAL